MKESFTEQLREQVKGYKDSLEVIKEYLSSEQIKSIQEVLNRLESLTINIAVFGETQSGKSALLNSLFGCDNNNPSECLFEVSDDGNWWSDEIALRNGKVWSQQDNYKIIIYDTPGIAGDINSHSDMAMNIVNKSDIVIVVIYEIIKGEAQVPFVKKILDSDKYYIFVINKIDIRKPSQIQAIKKDLFSKFDLKNIDVVECAGFPMTGEANTKNLSDKLVALIHTQQKNLIDETLQEKFKVGYEESRRELIKRAERQQQIIEEEEHKKLQAYEQLKEERLVKNHIIIHASALGAAATAGLLAQVYGGQELALTGITTLMTGTLCANYQAFNKSLVATFLSVLSGSIIGKTAASYAWRWLPGWGNAIEGAVTFGLHETQGWIIVSCLENGLHSKAEIEKFGIDKLKKQAKDMEARAKRLEGAMSAKEISKLKNETAGLKSEIEKMTENDSAKLTLEEDEKLREEAVKGTVLAKISEGAMSFEEISILKASLKIKE